MGHPIHSMTVERKLMLLFLGIIVIALLIAGLGFRSYSIRAYKSDLAGDLQTTARILGANSAGALRFNVPADAAELLAPLHLRPNIEQATIFNEAGELFAYFPEDSVPKLVIHPTEQVEKVLFSKEQIYVSQPIFHDDDQIGFIVLISNFSVLNARLEASFYVACMFFVLSLVCSIILIRTSLKYMFRPITNLVETAREISETGNYAVRAKRIHPDDLGRLTDQFNEMLDRIATREQQLQHEQVALRESQEKARELQTQLARSERMESLGILAGGVAHDLNNILGPLVGYPGLILEQLPQDSPVRKDVIQMKDAATKAARVIQDLLALGRRGNYNKSPIQLNDVIREYSESAGFQSLLKENPRIEFRTRLDPDLSFINGSTHHLTQVIMNLAINAVEAMPNGGTLTFRTSMCTLAEDSSQHEQIPVGEYVRFEAIDTGKGISNEDQEHIFEPFYTKKHMGRSGSGLGLAVVYGIVKDLGGFVDLTSTLNQGTTFTFYFPVSREPRLSIPEEEMTIHGTERILVIDDNREQRLLADRLLTSLGYTVDTAIDGHDGLEKVKKNEYDLIVLDMIMEDYFDGLDTFRAIRKIRPDQICIIASGFSESDRVHTAQQEGAGSFVTKPYTREGLGSAIQATLMSKS